MVDLCYERLSHLIALATLDPNDSVSKAFLLQEDLVTDRDITIRFSNYVKSQLHCYISEAISKKSFFKYINAYNYMNGDTQYYNDAMELLRCFYTDMATFLLHSNLDLHVTLIADINLDSVWKADTNKTKNEMLDLYNHSKLPAFKEYLDTFKYPWIIDCIDSIDDVINRIDNYAMAASIFEMLEDKKPYKFVEIKNTDNEEVGNEARA